MPFVFPPARRVASALTAVLPAVGVVAIMVVTVASKTAPQPGRFDPIASVVNEAIARHELPGAVVIVGHAGTIPYRGVFGDRAVAPAREPMTADTVFDLASLTKVVATTPSVMQLVEQGRIRLADPVSRYIPEFDRQATKAITVQQLLTHTSGFAPDLPLEVEFSGEDEAIRRAAAQPLAAPPGERFIYSDINFFVLGHLVKVVSGERIDQYAAVHVFAPLGMTETMFLPPDELKPRIAPTERCRPLAWPCGDPAVPFLRGIVHDPTARRMANVAGHAGLFSTADDLVKYCRMLLNGGAIGAARVLSPATVARMTRPATSAGMKDVRGLGWDIDSMYSANRGDLFPVGSSYGHTGFTGTSLWIDPTTDSFVVFLSNRVHPDGKGDVTPLRGKVATIAAAAISLGYGPESAAGPAVNSRQAAKSGRSGISGPPVSSSPAASTAANPTLAGIDVLEEEGFARVRGKRVALLTNQTGITRNGVSTIDALFDAPGVKLTTLFSPEHGIRGDRDEAVESSRDTKTGVPIYSLYGKDEASRHPAAAMLSGVDLVLVDIQDVGARFYTYPAAVAYMLQIAARQRVPVMLLDRPNPTGGERVEGPFQDRGILGYLGFVPMPIRHGLTIGELARLFNSEGGIGADLTVIPMKNWSRGLWFDETGLLWVNPSPNMRNLVAATLYPGIGSIEYSNVSVGRGTDTPFEQIGAPWIDGAALASTLNGRGIDGARFYPVTFTPAAGAQLGGQTCHGVFIVVTDRERLKPVRLGIEIASALVRMNARAFHLDASVYLLGSKALVDRINAGDDPEAIVASWAADEAKWRELREKYLLY